MPRPRILRPLCNNMVVPTRIATQTTGIHTTRRSVSARRWRVGLVALLLALLQIPVPAQPDSEGLQAPVRGELVLLTVELVVVKSVEGTNILIPLGKDIKLDPRLKVGDRVEVFVTPGNQASSVSKMSSEPSR